MYCIRMYVQYPTKHQQCFPSKPAVRSPASACYWHTPAALTSSKDRSSGRCFFWVDRSIKPSMEVLKHIKTMLLGNG